MTEGQKLDAVSGSSAEQSSAKADASSNPLGMDEFGEVVPDAEVRVTIGPQFLELFSEQLYTSPNKTFEELVSNSWDAGATDVRIGLSSNLADPEAVLWVLDNGESMDVEGFQRLWSVATSAKKDRVDAPRPQIGKFGIGKLATYLLAHQLTYVCKAKDGKIRIVGMDYRWIGEGDALHINPVPLPVREISQTEVDTFLQGLTDGPAIVQALEKLGKGKPWTSSGEFGGVEVTPPVAQGSWALAILSDLKEPGREIKAGQLQRMLRSSLPLGSHFSIEFNALDLESSKIDVPIADIWLLDENFPLTEFVVGEGEHQETIEITAASSPEPHISVAELGDISGRIALYEDSISGGKSNLLGASNGFFVNILGRVVNADDPYFGIQNLNHSAWAKFRATVRIDGLNDVLAVNREGILEGRKLDLAKALLRTFFNVARTAHDKAARAAWPDAGDILTETWGTVPLQPLRSAIDRGMESGHLPTFVTPLDDVPTETQRASWSQVSTHGDVLRDVSFDERGQEDPVVRYDLETRQIIVNESHPFVREYASSHELRLLVRDQAMADLLTSAYMSELGIDEGTLGQVELYRDQLLRLLSKLRRRTGLQIAELLDEAASHKKDKALEVILGDALEAVGFVVTRLGGSDNPEGVAVAPLSPKKTAQSGSYSFTYDAKSSAKRKVKTGNVGTGGLVRHRNDHSADFTLVVGPGFEDGALQKECLEQKITPMLATDLGRLVVATTRFGPFDMQKFKDIFDLYDPAQVTAFVDKFIEDWASQKTLTYGDIFGSLESLGFGGPDALTVSVIARHLRDTTGDPNYPTSGDVARVLVGMSILAPNLIRVQGDNVYLGARPDKFRETIMRGVAELPKKFDTP